MRPNLPQHPCANKCTDFKEEQCRNCLIQVNAADSDFLAGDVAVFVDAAKPDHLMTIHKVQKDSVLLGGNRSFALNHLIRSASVAELNANKRLEEA